MTENLKKAIGILENNNYTLVLSSDNETYTSNLSGVSSLLELYEEKKDYSSFSAADKVIGKGAAFLYVLMNIKEVHGKIVSKSAKEVLEKYSVSYYYNEEVPFIVNRKGDGICPIENATKDIDTPEKAYRIIKEALKILRNKQGEKSMKKLGFGCMRFPLTDKNDDEKVDLELVCKMVDRYLEEGFNYFDTAYMYHKSSSERIVKKALVERHSREKFFLADKMPVGMLNSEEDVDRIFLDQKEKCGVNYFDYYLLHCLNTENFEKAEKFDVFNYLSEKKKTGEIVRLGFSFHDTAEVLDRILTAHPEMEFVQLQINYLDWESQNVQSKLCYEVARKHNKPIIVMEPVRGGKLANVPSVVADMFTSRDKDLSVASWAIRFTASLPGVFCVLSGMSDLQQLEDNMSYMKDFRELTQEESELCLKAGKIIANDKTIPCTACRYCCEECVKAIAIPELFTLYNLRINGDESAKDKYISLSEKSDPVECIECKKCQQKCPQKIEIADQLKAVSASFKE